MKTVKRVGTKVIFGPVRLSYVHVFEKYAQEGSDPNNAKYGVTVLIPKTETEAIDTIQKAIAEATQAGVASKWKGRKPSKLDISWRDGDEKYADKDDEAFKGMWYFNASCKTKPGVVDRDSAPILDQEEVYSGVWAIVSVSFFPYSTNGNNGVAAGLNNLMKWKDDTRFGGRSSASADFSGLDLDDDDDDDM